MSFPIPVTVLTGFLGSGKTTLLKSLLRAPQMSGTAVIVNEFGEVGLDDALVEAADEDIVMLPSGCLCCAVRGDLIMALRKLADRVMSREIAEISRVVIETTGLADPAPIAHTLMTEDDLFRLFQLEQILTTVDAECGLEHVDDYFEPAKQIAIADRIVVTKTDRATADQTARVRARVAALNPAATAIEAVSGHIAPDLLFGGAAFEPAFVRDRSADWLAADAYAHRHDCGDEHCEHPSHHHHGDTGSRHLQGIQSFCLTFDEPLDGRKLSFALEFLRATHGDKLLRLKGIVAVAGEPKPFVVHGVQHVFYPPSPLESWPWDDHVSRLVFITRDLAEAQVREELDPILAPSSTAGARFGGPTPDYDHWTAD